MLKRISALAVFAGFSLFGCGQQSQEAKIQVSFLTENEMESLSHNSLGYASWNNDGQCYIYLLYPYLYDDKCHITKPTGAQVCGEDEYMYVLGHELRHCLEGKFHD